MTEIPTMAHQGQQAKPNGKKGTDIPHIHHTLYHTSPVIAVKSSPGVERVFTRTTLESTSTSAHLIEQTSQSLIRILSECGKHIPGTVQVEDIHGNLYQTDSFYARFISFQDIGRANGDTVATLSDLPSHLETTASKSIAPLLHQQSRIPTTPMSPAAQSSELKTATVAYNPWFKHYQDTLSTVGIAEHETFNHPLAYLIAVSENDEDPILEVHRMRLQTLPETVSNLAVVEPSLKIYLYIHDKSAVTTTDQDAETRFLAFKKEFPSAVLLSINTKPETTSEGQALIAEGIYNASYVSAFAETLGISLSKADAESVQSYVKDIVVPLVLNHHAKIMKEWERDIASSRRGISARLLKVGLKYFGGGSKPSSSSASQTPFVNAQGVLVFPSGSPEFIMRKLADLSFMMRDYKFAHTIYDTVKKDFISDERHAVYFTGVQEMIAICGFMIQNSKVPVDSLIDSTIALYAEAKRPAYSLRAIFFFSELHKEREAFVEAANLLIKSCSANDHQSALFLEEAGFCFAKAQNPRKLIFHLALAGHRFAKANCRAHAKLCNERVVSAFPGGVQHGPRGSLSSPHSTKPASSATLSKPSVKDITAPVSDWWSLIEDQCWFQLAKFAAQENDTYSATVFLLKLLRSSRSSASAQATYLREFLYAYKHWVVGAPEGESRRLEALFVPKIIPGSIALSTHDPSLGHKGETLMTSLTCAMGECVYLSFQFHNPLSVAIPLNSVFPQLSFNGEPKSEDIEFHDSPKIVRPEYEAECLFEVALDAKQTKFITFRITPKVEGTLSALGLAYFLNGVVPAWQPFTLPRVRLNTTLAQRVTPTYGPVSFPSIQVTCPMPILEVEQVHEFPDLLYAGQIGKFVVELCNRGQKDVKSLRVSCLSAPTWVVVGHPDEIETPFFDVGVSDRISLANSLTSVGGAFEIRLPQSVLGTEGGAEACLCPGSCMKLPIWVRADRTGSFTLDLQFEYSSVLVMPSSQKLSSSSGLPGSYEKSSFRVTPLSRSIVIQPAIQVNVFTRPSLKTFNHNIVGVEVENLTEYPVNVHQLSMLSPSWILCETDDLTLASEPILVPPKSSYYLYLSCESKVGECDIMTSPEMKTARALESLVLENVGGFVDFSAALDMRISSTYRGKHMGISPVVAEFFQRTKHSRRTAHLAAEYHTLTPVRIKDFFSLHLTEDVDLSILFSVRSAVADGSVLTSEPVSPTLCVHFVHTMNLCMQAPIQLASRLALKGVTVGALDAGDFGGRSLYASTAREKMELVMNLLRVKDASPIRVLVTCGDQKSIKFDPNTLKSCPISVSICNTSRFNAANYTISMSSLPISGVNEYTGSLGPCSMIAHVFNMVLLEPGVVDIAQWQLSAQMSACAEVIQDASSKNAGVSSKSAKSSRDSVSSSGRGADSVWKEGSFVMNPIAPYLLEIL